MTVRTPGSGAEAAVWSDYHRARRRKPLYRPWLYTAQKNEAIASCDRRRSVADGSGRRLTAAGAPQRGKQ